MINNSPEQPVASPSGKRPLGRRLALAGVLTAAALAGGGGVAYATGATGAGLVESGYATVVDEGQRAGGGDRADCPERGAGGGSTESPSESPSGSPEQLPTPEGDV